MSKSPPRPLQQIADQVPNDRADWALNFGLFKAQAAEAVTNNSLFGRIVAIRFPTIARTAAVAVIPAANTDTDETSGILGVAIGEITLGGYGLVALRKGMAGLDTSAAAVGDPVWLSTAGTWTLTKPTSGNLRVVGRVQFISSSTGTDTWIFFPEPAISAGTETVRRDSVAFVTTGSVKSKVVYPAGSIRLTIDTEAATADYTYTVPFACRLNPASVRGRTTGLGGAGDTVRLYKGTDAITEAFDLNTIADTTAFEFATWVKARLAFAAGDVIKLTTASGALAEIDLELEST